MALQILKDNEINAVRVICRFAYGLGYINATQHPEAKIPFEDTLLNSEYAAIYCRLLNGETFDQIFPKK